MKKDVGSRELYKKIQKYFKDGLPHHIYAYTFQEITLHFSSTFIAFVSTLHFSSNYVCNSIKSKVYKNAI